METKSLLRQPRRTWTQLVDHKEPLLLAHITMVSLCGLMLKICVIRNYNHNNITAKIIVISAMKSLKKKKNKQTKNQPNKQTKKQITSRNHTTHTPSHALSSFGDGNEMPYTRCSASSFWSLCFHTAEDTLIFFFQKTKQNKTKQNKNKTKQNKTKQNKTKPKKMKTGFSDEIFTR